MADATEQPQRKRLQPEERKAMILDHAAAFIREYGVSALNMDRLGRHAGVSKPLVYAYFTNRIGLLKALLVREVKKRRAADRAAAEAATSMDEIIKLASRSMLNHVQESGIVIQQLLLEPEIAVALNEMRAQSRDAYVDYLADQVTSHYKIPRSLSPMIVEIVMGLGTAAGAHFDRTRGDIDQVHDVLVTMTTGALEAAAKKYGKPDKRKSTRRRKSGTGRQRAATT